MRVKTLSVTSSAGVSHSQAYVVDSWISPCNIALAVVCSGPLAVADVQYTLADPFENNLNTAVSAHAWLNHATLASCTAAPQNGMMAGNFTEPPRAIRLRLRAPASASTNDRATLIINQGGPNT